MSDQPDMDVQQEEVKGEGPALTKWPRSQTDCYYSFFTAVYSQTTAVETLPKHIGPSKAHKKEVHFRFVSHKEEQKQKPCLAQIKTEHLGIYVLCVLSKKRSLGREAKSS